MSSQSVQTKSVEDHPPSIISIFRQGGLAILFGLVINIPLYFIGARFFNAFDGIVLRNGQVLNLVNIVSSSIIFPLVGIICYLILSRYVSRGWANTIFLVVSSLLMLTFFPSGPLQIPGATVALNIFLNLMHVGSGLPLMALLIRSK